MSGSNGADAAAKQPDVSDLPLGLGMRLLRDPAAFDAFDQKAEEEKAELLAYIRSAESSKDAKLRIAEVVSQLKPDAAF